MTDLDHRLKGYRMLRGRGLEIGAFNQPATVPPGCTVEYCDACSREEGARLFAELDPDVLVAVDHVVDLDAQGLAPFADQRFDFTILNHVIEHVANPIRVVDEVFRVTRIGGLAVISAPDKTFTFDRDRALTPYSHLLLEYLADVQQVSDPHYLDFLEAVHPNVMKGTPQQIQEAVSRVRERREHAHVWDSQTFIHFLETSLGLLNIAAQPVCRVGGKAHVGECFSVWRKHRPLRGLRPWARRSGRLLLKWGVRRCPATWREHILQQRAPSG